MNEIPINDVDAVRNAIARYAQRADNGDGPGVASLSTLTAVRGMLA